MFVKSTQGMNNDVFNAAMTDQLFKFYKVHANVTISMSSYQFTELFFNKVQYKLPR